MSHRYPGLGLPLRHFDQSAQLSQKGDVLYPMGIHTNCWGSDSEMILVREIAMMIIMDRLSEKPLWYEKVFDDGIAEKWIEEALAMPVNPLWDSIVQGKVNDQGRVERYPKRLATILDRGCLEYCIKELRAKADFFKKTQLIPTLDASATVVKSDTLVDESLHNDLRSACDKLIDNQTANPDWHPKTNDKVQNLIHPSMYPLVFGKSRVFQEEVVGVEDAIFKWAGKGEVISGEETPANHTHYSTNIGGSQPRPELWSSKYQWLPSNVKFQDDGSVRFTSYINNLHPTEHQGIYKVIERLIEKALPAWDLCLAPYSHSRSSSDAPPTAGRTIPRFPMPQNPDDDNEDNWDPPISQMKWPLDSADVKRHQSPSDDGSVSLHSDEDDEDEDEEYEEEQDSEGNWYHGTKQEIHWQKIRKPVQPEAPTFQAWDYGVKAGKSLREQFPDIQVIVKMASIELTPDKPEFPQGSWHVEGQLNEKIVATALYYFDSENVTTSSLDFRMQTSPYQEDHQSGVGQDNFTWLSIVYGTQLRNAPCLQNYGSVETKEGRLVAFPNTFHHRVSPFQLKDKTKPGHRRFIAIWLVDPLNRIINTANVPPQQQSWWLEETFGKLGESDVKKVPHSIAELISEQAGTSGVDALRAAVEGKQDLPAELLEMVRAELGGDSLPMSEEEAKKHRLELMEGRTKVEETARNGWVRVDYNFCEH